MTENPPATSLPRLGNGSLTERATKALLDAIMARQFPENRLPSEPELATQLAVSRTTIRAALQTLERLGVVSRTPGRGTMVRPHVGRETIALQRLIGFRALLEEEHQEVHVDQRYWLPRDVPDYASAALCITSASPVVRTSKTFWADGAPAIYINDTIPLETLRPERRAALDDSGTIPGSDSIFEFSRTWTLHEIDHTVVEIVPAVVEDVPDFPLALPAGTPYLVLDEIHHDAHGVPYIHSRVHVDDRFVRFRVVRHR